MQNIFTLSRRSFIKLAGFTCGYAVLGLNLAKEVAAAAVSFVGQRQASVYAADANDAIYAVKKSQDNPMITLLYDKQKGFLKDGPCGHESHHLLHTHYTDKSAGVKALKAKGVKLAL